MVIRWRADDGPILVAFGSTHQLNKNVVKVGPLLKIILDPRMGLSILYISHGCILTDFKNATLE